MTRYQIDYVAPELPDQWVTRFESYMTDDQAERAAMLHAKTDDTEKFIVTKLEDEE